MIETTEKPPIASVGEHRLSFVEQSQWIFARVIAWIATSGWRATADWPSVRPVLIRLTGHLAVVVLALAALFLARLDLSQADADFDPSNLVQPQEISQQISASRQPVVKAPITALNIESPALDSDSSVQAFSPPDDGRISRLAVPQTIIPERPRTGVFTYTVQAGDTIFGISEEFGLTPYTIYWANSETLNDNPHQLKIDMQLYILPVDGVYHTVAEDETVGEVIEEYDIEPEALYNEWNNIQPGEPLVLGTKLVIPGGAREFIVWQLPTYTSSGIQGGGNSGLCAGPFNAGVIGGGFFTWPTTGRRISGWVFRDPRNPAHGGIDIGLSIGDPIFAADNGVIVYAGWNTWGYGYLVVVDHGNGWQTWYAHLSQINVYCGQGVWQGSVIGLGGSTGRSTGPHLHFEIRYEGSVVDPFSYLP